MDFNRQIEEGKNDFTTYFRKFESRQPKYLRPLKCTERFIWHFLAGATFAAGIRYLYWRWTDSLNFDAIFFSVVVALAETLTLIGTALFYFDIWDESDSQFNTFSTTQNGESKLTWRNTTTVDILIATVDENIATLKATIEAAQCLIIPPDTQVKIHVLDDGKREAVMQLAQLYSAQYLTRQGRDGFKAGNISNALFYTSGEFVVICDADTRLLPSFLENTLGYFSDDKVAWVQTPHWFYDLPNSKRATKRSKTKSSIVTWLRQVLGKQWVETKEDRIFDPFMSDPSVFFDIIQRRRNRNSSSFCCGAASIHRREAIFSSSLSKKYSDSTNLFKENFVGSLVDASQCIPLEPFRFHVSEDLYSSIITHGSSEEHWKSVYHPQIEAKMLSPWSVQAWALQRLKYAKGTFDIALHGNVVFNSKLHWKTRLHYLSTFWSYATSLWMPILIFAPAISLFTGLSAVETYSAQFFEKFIPMIVLGEIALIFTSKGHPISEGRAVNITCMYINLISFISVVSGRKANFSPTPKTPAAADVFRHVYPNIATIVILLASGIFGVTSYFLEQSNLAFQTLIFNLFWLTCNLLLLSKIFGFIFWKPSTSLSTDTD